MESLLKRRRAASVHAGAEISRRSFYRNKPAPAGATGGAPPSRSFAPDLAPPSSLQPPELGRPPQTRPGLAHQPADPRAGTPASDQTGPRPAACSRQSWDARLRPDRAPPTSLQTPELGRPPQAKRLSGHGHSPTQQLPEPTVTSRQTATHGPAHRRARQQLHPPVGRKPQSHSRPDPTLGQAGPQPCPLAGQHKLWDTPDPIPSCVGNSHTPQQSDTSSGIPGHCIWIQDLALPALSPALTPGPGFTHQWEGNSPRVFWTLTPPTSEPALAPGPPRVLQPAN